MLAGFVSPLLAGGEALSEGVVIRAALASVRKVFEPNWSLAVVAFAYRGGGPSLSL